jgi:hypothetical protein
MRVNSDVSSMSNNEEKPPRPMRVNGQPNRAPLACHCVPPLFWPWHFTIDTIITNTSTIKIRSNQQLKKLLHFKFTPHK